jgi:hypothetical protein
MIATTGGYCWDCHARVELLRLVQDTLYRISGLVVAYPNNIGMDAYTLAQDTLRRIENLEGKR